MRQLPFVMARHLLMRQQMGEGIHCLLEQPIPGLFRITQMLRVSRMVRAQAQIFLGRFLRTYIVVLKVSFIT